MFQTLSRRTAFLSVLAVRDFRIFSAGLLTTVLGRQILVVTQAWLVYDMTGSPLALGVVGGAHAVPGILVALFSGALADRFDPRRIILAAEAASALLLLVLATLVATGLVQVWHIIVVAFLTGITQAFDSPARRSIWAPMVPREKFLFAISVNSSIWNVTHIAAPALAGAIIASVGSLANDDRVGAGAGFYVAFAGFLTMVIAMRMVRVAPAQRSRGATVFHDIVDGFVFMRRNRVHLYLLALSLSAGYFGLSYIYLMPVFAEDYLRVGPGGYGALLSMAGIGGLVGMMGVASFGQYQDRPWLIIGSLTLAGSTMVLFAVTTAMVQSYVLAMAFMVVIGGSFAVFQVATSTAMNLLVPDEYRGRIMGFRGIMFSLAPLGSLQAGVIASVSNTPLAVGFAGAMLAVIGLLVYVVSPDIRGLRRIVTEANATYAQRTVSGG